MKFALKHTHKQYDPTVRAIKHMMNTQKTVSDSIIKEVKQKSYSLDDIILQEVCAEIAVKQSEKLLNSVAKTKESVTDLDYLS